MEEETKTNKVIVDDWRAIFKRWSTQITILAITAQTVWGNMPVEARELLHSPQYVGLGLGIAALVAMFIKQGGGTNEQ